MRNNQAEKLINKILESASLSEIEIKTLQKLKTVNNSLYKRALHNDKLKASNDKQENQ